MLTNIYILMNEATSVWVFMYFQVQNMSKYDVFIWLIHYEQQEEVKSGGYISQASHLFYFPLKSLKSWKLYTIYGVVETYVYA